MKGERRTACDVGHSTFFGDYLINTLQYRVNVLRYQSDNVAYRFDTIAGGNHMVLPDLSFLPTSLSSSTGEGDELSSRFVGRKKNWQPLMNLATLCTK